MLQSQLGKTKHFISQHKSEQVNIKINMLDNVKDITIIPTARFTESHRLS